MKAGAGKYDLAFVRRRILARRGFAEKCALTVAMIALPALLRYVVDRGGAGFPFAPFYPFVVLAAILLDWRFATVVVIGAGVLSAYVFPRFAISTLPLAKRAVISGLYLAASAMLIVIGAVLRRALAELQEASERQTLAAQELLHRFKNMVAVVNALALQTVRNSPPGEFYPVLSGRLDALIRAADLATLELSPCELGTLVDSAIEPFQLDGRIRANGPAATLASRHATALLLALHELATNAVKYGALSRPEGTIAIDWTAVAEGTAVHLVWHERGGPPLTPPAKTGFGSRLLQTLPDAIAVTRHFEPEGLRCEIRIAL
jgi:two-component sensor histidine kinase